MIGASSAGTVIEWYDFYLYATLTPFLAPIFFPPGDPTSQLLAAFAVYGDILVGDIDALGTSSMTLFRRPATGLTAGAVKG